MMEEKQYIMLTNQQKESISKYLESRLGVFGINWFEFEWDYDEHRTYKESANQIIKPKYLGICKHMIKECRLIVKVWGLEAFKNISLALSYDHKPCGSNGHDMDINLVIIQID